ncbi:MAG: hypothetical protein ACTSUE_08115 [Promethearchaeota archaeon]
MKLVCSLNGLDKSGKSTQTDMLGKHFKILDILGPLSRYQPWPRLEGQELFNWWFIEGETKTVIKTIYRCLQERNKEIIGSFAPIVLIDRGITMFDAVCVASVMIREKMGRLQAESIVNEIKTTYKIEDIEQFLSLQIRHFL